MDREAIAHQCAAMHDQELVRALTLDKTEYSDEFRIQAMRELAQRGTPLESFLDLVAVQRESGVEERLTLPPALAQICRPNLVFKTVAKMCLRKNGVQLFWISFWINS